MAPLRRRFSSSSRSTAMSPSSVSLLKKPQYLLYTYSLPLSVSERASCAMLGAVALLRVGDVLADEVQRGAKPRLLGPAAAFHDHGRGHRNGDEHGNQKGADGDEEESRAELHAAAIVVETYKPKKSSQRTLCAIAAPISDPSSGSSSDIACSLLFCICTRNPRSTIEMTAATFLPRRVTSTGSLPKAARLITWERLSRSSFVVTEGRGLGGWRSRNCAAMP